MDGLCVFQVDMLGDWWYLVPQCALYYFDLLEHLHLIFWLAWDLKLKLGTPGQATIPKLVYFHWLIQFFSNIC